MLKRVSKDKDVNQIVSFILQEAIGKDQPKELLKEKNPAAVALGQLKCGKAKGEGGAF